MRKKIQFAKTAVYYLMKNIDYFSSCRTWKKSFKIKWKRCVSFKDKSRSKKKSWSHKTRFLIHTYSSSAQWNPYHQHRMAPPLENCISLSNHSMDLKINLYNKKGWFCHSRLLHFTRFILPFTKLTRQEEINLSASGSL